MPFDPESLIHAFALKLATVSGLSGGAAVISEYRRDVRSEADAARLWIPVGGTKVHAWNVTLNDGPTGNSTRGPGFNDAIDQPGRVLTDLSILIEGVASVIDSDTQALASEVLFRQTCWNVVKALNRRALIASYVTNQGACQWERFGYMLLAGMYSVHYCRLRVSCMGQVFP